MHFFFPKSIVYILPLFDNPLFASLVLTWKRPRLLFNATISWKLAFYVLRVIIIMAWEVYMCPLVIHSLALSLLLTK